MTASGAQVVAYTGTTGTTFTGCTSSGSGIVSTGGAVWLWTVQFQPAGPIGSFYGLQPVGGTLWTSTDYAGLSTTTVAAGSNGVNVATFVGAQTLTVATGGLTNFPASGTITVVTSTGTATITYTSVTVGPPATFNACTTTSGTGTLATGNQVSANVGGVWNATDGATFTKQNALPFVGPAASIAHNVIYGNINLAEGGGNEYWMGTQDTANGTGIYRSKNGVNWTQIVRAGFALGAQEQECYNLFFPVGQAGPLLASTFNQTIGGSVWITIDGYIWNRVGNPGFAASAAGSTEFLGPFNFGYYPPTGQVICTQRVTGVSDTTATQPYWLTIPASIQNPQIGEAPVAQLAPISGTVADYSGTIAAGGTAQQAAPANAVRQYVLIQNPSTTTGQNLWFNFDVTAVQSQPSVLLTPNGSNYIAESSYIPTGAISVIGATTAQPFVVKCGPT
jgi:hypothetical protein